MEPVISGQSEIKVVAPETPIRGEGLPPMIMMFPMSYVFDIVKQGLSIEIDNDGTWEDAGLQKPEDGQEEYSILRQYRDKNRVQIDIGLLSALMITGEKYPNLEPGEVFVVTKVEIDNQNDGAKVIIIGDIIKFAEGNNDKDTSFNKEAEGISHTS